MQTALASLLKSMYTAGRIPLQRHAVTSSYPPPLLLSAEEGGRVSLTLEAGGVVRWKCPPTAVASVASW